MILGDNINGRSREIEVEMLFEMDEKNKKYSKKKKQNTWRTLLHHFSHFSDNGTYFELFDSKYNVVDDDNYTNKIRAHNVRHIG